MQADTLTDGKSVSSRKRWDGEHSHVLRHTHLTCARINHPAKTSIRAADSGARCDRPMKEWELDEAMHIMDADGSGQVDYEECVPFPQMNLVRSVGQV